MFCRYLPHHDILWSLCKRFATQKYCDFCRVVSLPLYLPGCNSNSQEHKIENAKKYRLKVVSRQAAGLESCQPRLTFKLKQSDTLI